MNRLLPVVFAVTVLGFLSCGDDPTSVNVPLDGALSGRILPADIGATVTAIQGTTVESDVCDDEGNYSISGLTAGSCLLKISAEGFGTYQTTVTLAGGGRNQVNDITLQRIPYPVRSVSPSLNSSWNSTSTTISLSFALPMDTGSVRNAFDITPDVQGTLTWTSDFSQVFFRPAALLRTGTTYTVTLDSSARTQDGAVLEFPLEYTFSIEPLRVSNFSPAAGAEDVSLSQQTYFYFNGPCDKDSVEAAVKVSPATDLSFSWSGQYLYVRPASGYWRGGASYRLIVGSRAQDPWGHRISMPCTLSFSTVPLTVTSLSPYPGQTNVSFGTSLSIGFPAPMNRSYTEKAFSFVDADTNDVPGTISWSSTGMSFTFSPSTGLPPATTYTMSIDTVARDLYGSRLRDTVATFTTDAFRITSVSPARGSGNVSLSQQVYFYFNSRCDTDSAEAAVKVSPSTALAFSWSGQYLYVSPSGGYWKAGTQYSIIMRTRARDAWGHALAVPCTTTFTTVPLKVTSLSPYPGQTGVSLSASISVNFLAAMNKQLTEGAFSCVDASSNPAEGTFSWSSNGTSLYFYPAASLQPGVEYTVSISDDAEDLLGTPLKDTTFSFTTDVFRITSLWPSPGTASFNLNQQVSLSFNALCNLEAVQNAIDIEPAIDLNYSWSGNTLYLRPTSNYWAGSTTYTLTVDTSARSASGTPLSKSSVTTFTTVTGGISSFSPSDGEINVSLTRTVYLYFNVPIDPVTAIPALTVVDDRDSVHAGVVSMSGGTTLYFTPSAPYLPGHDYTVNLDQTATDKFGGSIAPVSFGFTADYFGVSSSYPSPEGSNWGPGQSPYLYFKTSADAAACEAAFSIEPAIELDFSWSNNYLYYKPRSNYWRSNTRYEVTLDASAGDIWGGTMDRPYTTSFYTQDARITSVSPVFGTANISINTSVSISFNTAMDPATIATAFTLETEGGTPVAGTVSGSQTSYSFTPSAALDPTTGYVIRVGTDAADMFGEQMLAEWTSTFTTGN